MPGLRSESWTNPVHMQRLEAYLEEEARNRLALIQNLNNNMETIQDKLNSPLNYRKFYWTPDYNIYGFATKNQVRKNQDDWQKQDATRRAKEQKAAHMAYLEKVNKAHQS